VQAKQSAHCWHHKEAEALIVRLWQPIKIRGGFNLCAATFDQRLSQPYATKRKHTQENAPASDVQSELTSSGVRPVFVRPRFEL
jgi:hypothetical protein